MPTLGEPLPTVRQGLGADMKVDRCSDNGVLVR
jgi:hypothetical protein